jgi:hypothetical protein
MGKVVVADGTALTVRDDAGNICLSLRFNSQTDRDTAMAAIDAVMQTAVEVKRA